MPVEVKVGQIWERRGDRPEPRRIRIGHIPGSCRPGLAPRITVYCVSGLVRGNPVTRLTLSTLRAKYRFVLDKE